MNGDRRRLARRLGHRFRREDLLDQALTHRSAGGVNNERLEFLGDALIGFVVAEALVGCLPEADEGTLSRMRAALVKREALAALARGLGLGEYLRLGAGELRTGGYNRDSILADALEAVLGAVYLDGGFDTARTVAMGLFGASLGEVSAAPAGKDPKTQLQELLQAQRRPIPEYQVLSIEGSQHAQAFRVSCLLPDEGTCTQGEGSSRRRAEQAAAQAMLAGLRDQAERERPRAARGRPEHV
jgi:ribonuclease III